MTTKEQLLAEAAIILEQEGWLLKRLAHDGTSGRMRAFADRYQTWQLMVDDLRRTSPPGHWPPPPDNS